MDDSVAREKRNGLLQIRYRIEYDAINRRRRVGFAFLLRTSAIRASPIAFGLASVTFQR